MLTAPQVTLAPPPASVVSTPVDAINAVTAAAWHTVSQPVQLGASANLKLSGKKTARAGDSEGGVSKKPRTVAPRKKSPTDPPTPNLLAIPIVPGPRKNGRKPKQLVSKNASGAVPLLPAPQKGYGAMTLEPQQSQQQGQQATSVVPVIVNGQIMHMVQGPGVGQHSMPVLMGGQHVHVLPGQALPVHVGLPSGVPMASNGQQGQPPLQYVMALVTPQQQGPGTGTGVQQSAGAAGTAGHQAPFAVFVQQPQPQPQPQHQPQQQTSNPLLLLAEASQHTATSSPVPQPQTQPSSAFASGATTPVGNPAAWAMSARNSAVSTPITSPSHVWHAHAAQHFFGPSQPGALKAEAGADGFVPPQSHAQAAQGQQQGNPQILQLPSGPILPLGMHTIYPVMSGSQGVAVSMGGAQGAADTHVHRPVPPKQQARRGRKPRETPPEGLSFGALGSGATAVGGAPTGFGAGTVAPMGGGSQVAVAVGAGAGAVPGTADAAKRKINSILTTRTREELLKLSTKELNQFAAANGLTMLEMTELKTQRRRVKNRQAAQACRKKKKRLVTEMELRYEELKRESDRMHVQIGATDAEREALELAREGLRAQRERLAIELEALRKSTAPADPCAGSDALGDACATGESAATSAGSSVTQSTAESCADSVAGDDHVEENASADR